ncbi:MAG: sigma factor [Planctomycetota bacterium]
MPGHLPTTTTILLESLRDARNGNAWTEFDRRYRPVLTGFARSLGLNDSDAADAAQWALAQFAQDYAAGRYVRGKGRLSSWIMGIARHRIERVRNAGGPVRGAKGKDARGESVLGAMPDEAGLTQLWDRQREAVIIGRAMEALRTTEGVDPAKLKAFELVALHDVPVEEAARQCGMTPADVYVAKSRLSRKLRELVETIGRAYAEDA